MPMPGIAEMPPIEDTPVGTSRTAIETNGPQTDH